VNIIDIIFYVMERGGRGLNMIDIMFYVME
jgi:hypothetical protein